MRFNIKLISCCALLLFACSDFDDWNTPYDGEDLASGSESILENLRLDDSMSDFYSLVLKGGYADALNTSQYYTVFAPVNGFDVNYYLAMDSASLVHKFLENHIVRGNYQLSGAVDKRVHMLNEKSYRLIGDQGNYSFGGKDIEIPNRQVYNGLIHVMSDAAEFRSNVYEYIFEASASGYECDSVSDYFKKYEIEELDEGASVLGPNDENGNPTYYDSVMYVHNTLTENLFRVQIDNEDSNYTMFLPNNEAWIKAYESIKPSYTFISSVPYTEVVFSGSSSVTKTSRTKSVDVDLLEDSLTCRAIMKDAFFNNNDKEYNHDGYIDVTPAPDDTIYTTSSNKLSNVSDMLSFTINSRDSMEMSNGYVRIVDSLAYYPWETWKPEIEVLLSGSDFIGSLSSVSEKTTITVTQMGNTEKLTYMDVQPNQDSSQPEVYAYLPNVLSNTYNIYCVFVSPLFAKNKSQSEYTDSLRIDSTYTREYKVNFTLDYALSTGKTETLSSWKNLETTFFTRGTDSVKVNCLLDTMLVAEAFEFPVSYYGLYSKDTPCAPYFTAKSARASYNKGKTEYYLYDNELRILSFILRPVEYDKYLNNVKEDED